MKTKLIAGKADTEEELQILEKRLNEYLGTLEPAELFDVKQSSLSDDMGNGRVVYTVIVRPLSD